MSCQDQHRSIGAVCLHDRRLCAVTGWRRPEYSCHGVEDQASAIKGGNLDRIEDMLIAQTHTLDAVANYMFQCVTRADTMSKVETYMKFGLRAQSQCRSNAEAIANMKNPRTHLNQTNIGYNQQVNNVQSKLLEEKDGERLDFGKAATPIRGDQDLEAVGTKHRAKDA